MNSAAPVRDSEGKIIGAITTNLDITAQRQAEQALRESEAKYRLIIENAKEGIWTVDANRQTLYVNEQMAAMLGYSVQEMMELPWTTFVREAVEQEGSDRRVQERKQGVQRSSEQYDLRLACKDGSTRWVIVHSAPRFDAQGRYLGSTSMVTDITERKQAEQEREQLLVQARQDAQVKAALLNEVNHRVKNNLSAIVGLLYTHLDHAVKPSSSEYRALVRELTHRIEGLSIVHGLLSRSQWAPLRLDELAERIFNAAMQGETSGRVTVEIAPSFLLVSPDQAQTMALVLNELALNIAKHNTPGTAVRVTVEAVQEQNQVILTVRDSGPGYPEPVITGQETGVGLDLLRNLVRQNLRGQMILRNENGAVAEVRFPLMIGQTIKGCAIHSRDGLEQRLEFGIVQGNISGEGGAAEGEKKRLPGRRRRRVYFCAQVPH